MSRLCLLVLVSLASPGCRRDAPREAPPPPAAEDPCRASRECHEFGMCTSQNGFCAAVTDADCEQSRSCERYGACAARVGRCVGTPRPTCRGSGSLQVDWCRLSDCEPYGRICDRPITSDAACSAPREDGSPGRCAVEGLCVARDGFCVAESDDLCRASDMCRTRGHCIARNGLCVAESAAACAASANCRDSGECSRGANFCYATDADCAKQPACRERGERCKSNNGQCEALGFIYFQF